MRIKITDNLDARYASSMAKGMGLKTTGADYKVFLQNSRNQPSMRGWWAVMDFLQGEWVDVETDYLFEDQFNIGDPPGFIPPEGRGERVTGARVNSAYVDEIDFSPEFADVDEYLAAVQARYDKDWPGHGEVRRILANRIALGNIKDVTPQAA